SSIVLVSHGLHGLRGFKIREIRGLFNLSMFQPAFGFDRSHASGACSSDGLPENRILNVATGKHAGNIRTCRIGLRLDVPMAIEIDLPFENIRVRIVTDRYK